MYVDRLVCGRKFSRRQTIEIEKMTSTSSYKNEIIAQEIETKYFAVD